MVHLRFSSKVMRLVCLPGKVQLAGHFITTITTAGFFLITHQPQQKHRRSIQPCFLMHRQYNKCDSTGNLQLTVFVCTNSSQFIVCL